jgi:hypothetical protein
MQLEAEENLHDRRKIFASVGGTVKICQFHDTMEISESKIRILYKFRENKLTGYPMDEIANFQRK